MQAWASYPGNQITLAVLHLGGLKIRRHAELAGTAKREFKSESRDPHPSCTGGPRYPHPQKPLSARPYSHRHQDKEQPWRSGSQKALRPHKG